MSSELTNAAFSAGMIDTALLKLADPALTPAEAVSQLRERYPNAFQANVRSLAPADYKTAEKAFLAQCRDRFFKRSADTEMTRIRAKYEGK